LRKSDLLKTKTVESVMSKSLVTIDADNTALQAAKIMSEKLISSIIVIDSSKIVGILTERDLIKLICAADLQASKAPIASIMSSPLIAVDKDSRIENAAEIMIRNKVRHLGVRDRTAAGQKSNDHIIGIISSVDLIRSLIMHKLESINDDDQALLRALYWQEEPMEELDF